MRKNREIGKEEFQRIIRHSQAEKGTVYILRDGRRFLGDENGSVLPIPKMEGEISGFTNENLVSRIHRWDRERLISMLSDLEELIKMNIIGNIDIIKKQKADKCEAAAFAMIL